MSAEINRLEEQLSRAFEVEAWHGPSVLESLAEAGAKGRTRKGAGKSDAAVRA